MNNEICPPEMRGAVGKKKKKRRREKCKRKRKLRNKRRIQIDTIRPMVQYMRFVKLSKNHSISYYYRHRHFVFL